MLATLAIPLKYSYIAKRNYILHTVAQVLTVWVVYYAYSRITENWVSLIGLIYKFSRWTLTHCTGDRLGVNAVAEFIFQHHSLFYPYTASLSPPPVCSFVGSLAWANIRKYFATHSHHSLTTSPQPTKTCYWGVRRRPPQCARTGDGEGPQMSCYCCLSHSLQFFFIMYIISRRMTVIRRRS